MPTGPIDYAALAQQARSTVPPAIDYAALAAQARGQDTGPPSGGPTPYVDTSNVAGAQGPLPTPANYSQSAGATGVMQPATWGPGGNVSQKLLGDQPLRNSGIVVGQHLKNAVTAPYHAFTDAPANPQEAAEAGTDDSSNLAEQGLGHVGLGFARMLVNPTLNAGSAAYDAAKAGDYNTAGQRALDAIPVAGPWARQVENDAQTYGAIPSLLGLGTDLASAKAVEPALKTTGYVANKVGRLGEFVGADPAAQKLMASRIMVPGSPGELLQRGLKPDLRYGANPSGMLEDTLPSVIAQDPNVSTVSGYAKAADAARDSQGKLAFFDPVHLLNSDGSVRQIHEIEPRHRVSIAGFEVCELFEGQGEQKHAYGLLKKVKLVDKTRNLDMLARYFKMYKEDGGPEVEKITAIIMDL